MTRESITTISDKLKDMHDDIREIKTQAYLTNGRVTKLETWQAIIEDRNTKKRWYESPSILGPLAIIAIFVSAIMGIRYG